MNHAARASAMQVAESHWTVWWSRLQTVRTSAAGLHIEEDTSDWCSEWSRSPQSSWHEAEKSNLKHDMCGAGEQDEREQQDGWAEEQKGGGEDTCDCDSESHSIPWSRVGKCSHDESKAG